MFKNLRNNGFASIIEITIAAVIFAVAAVGVFTIIASMRPKGIQAAKKLEATYAARQLVDELRGQIDARMWDESDDLISNIVIGPDYQTTIGNHVVHWSLEDVPGMELRKLTVNVEY